VESGNWGVQAFTVHWRDNGGVIATCGFITLDGYVIPAGTGYYIARVNADWAIIRKAFHFPKGPI